MPMVADESHDENTQSFVALTKGTKVSHYEIIEKIGAGGMGEVYLARDSRLDREVALKVISRHVSRSPERRARLEREARITSQLNHPHICTLYDIGDLDDSIYLVLEFIKGKTLAERLLAGPLSFAEVLTYGIQIADALGRAHQAGVVHRDIKPRNLMVTSQGIKLLDFGIARPAAARVPSSAADQEETVDSPMTVHGAIIGTLSYMSPEQLEGKEVDARADVFALGCVLFEMATGKCLFECIENRESLSANLNLNSSMPGQLVDSATPRLWPIVNRCLQKDASGRFADAMELCKELRGLEEWYQRHSLRELSSIIETMQVPYEGPESWHAFELTRDIARFSPNHTELEGKWPEFSARITVTSDPPGAEVYACYYGDETSRWIQMGATPLKDARFPRGFTRVKLESPGYRTAQDVVFVGLSFVIGASDKKSATWHYRLFRPGEIPDTMEFVPGGRLSLFMPSLGHLEAEPMVAFLIDRDPVTNRQFKEFVDAGGYQTRDYWLHSLDSDENSLSWEQAMAKFTDQFGRPGPTSWEFGDYPPGQDEYPVVGISWFEAAAYATWAGKELPTIFHWNRVAFTVAASQMIPLANLSGQGLLPIGQTNCMNRFGVRDLAGNCREWVFNACSRSGERFILGGGRNDPAYAFVQPDAQSAFDRSHTNGFRCIRPVEQEENSANLRRVVKLPYRDFRSETPASDEMFKFYVRQFKYDRQPLDAHTKEEIPIAGGIRQLISFAAAYGDEEMLAYLFVPNQGRLPLQTVVVFPGSAAIDLPSLSPSDARRIDFLVKSGRAVMHPIYKGTYQRRDALKSDWPEETVFYKDHVVMWAKDLGRSIDYLESRSDIDSRKIAYFGYSWGGALGAIMLAIELRIKVAVLYVAGFCFQRALPEVDQINYVSRVKQPTLMLNGENDFHYPLESAQRPMFDLLGTPPEHKRRISYPLGHSVPRQGLITETLAWLDRYLGPT